MSAIPPPPPNWDVRPADADRRRYAGFWLRFGAWIVDALLLGAVWYAVSQFLPSVPARAGLEPLGPYVLSLPLETMISLSAGLLWEYWLESLKSPQMIAETMGRGLLIWAYYAVLESSRLQATLGKHLFSIRVGAADSSRLSLPAASLRAWPHYLVEFAWFGSPVLDGVVMAASLAAVLAIAFSRRKQGLHDRMARAFLTRR